MGFRRLTFTYCCSSSPMKFSVEKLDEMGFKLAMYSTAAVLTVQHALFEVYTTIREHGHTEKMRDRMTTFAQYRALVDEDLWNDMHNISGVKSLSLKKVTDSVDSLDSPLGSTPNTSRSGCDSPSSTSRYHM